MMKEKIEKALQGIERSDIHTAKENIINNIFQRRELAYKRIIWTFATCICTMIICFISIINNTYNNNLFHIVGIVATVVLYSVWINENDYFWRDRLVTRIKNIFEQISKKRTEKFELDELKRDIIKDIARKEFRGFWKYLEQIREKKKYFQTKSLT